MTKLMKTKDYSIFKFHENNRPINQSNLKNLIFSLKAQNLLEFRPILVDKDLRIIDGQHRYEAAKTLGLEIYYQVNEEASHEDIVLLNSYQKKWETRDWINYYATLGNKEYIALYDYAKKRNVSENEILSLLKGTRKELSNDIKQGKFKFIDNLEIDQIDKIIDNVNKILDTLDRYLISGKKFLNSPKLKRALVSLIKKGIDIDILITKITQKTEALHPCADTYGYYCMIRDIYNWKNQDPIE